MFTCLYCSYKVYSCIKLGKHKKELKKAPHSKNAYTFITVFLIFMLYLSCSKYKTSYYLILNINKLHKQNNQPCPWHLKGNMFNAFDLMKSKANLLPLNQTDNFQDSSFFFSDVDNDDPLIEKINEIFSWFLRMSHTSTCVS